MRLAVLVVCVALLLPGLARADEGDVPVDAEWYGAPMLGADIGALGLIYLGDRAHSDYGDGTVMLGAGALLVDGPIGHAMHGHWGHASASFALRVGVPLLGLMLGSATCSASAGVGCNDSAQNGALFGMFTAVVLDDLLLAVDEKPREGGLQVSLAPQGQGGFVAGVGGSF